MPGEKQNELEFLLRRAIEVLPSTQELEKRISKKGKLRVKLGIDPTSTDLTLGHSVVLQKLADFQAMGHTAVLIFGDFTGMVGDPSGRNKSRPPLSLEQAQANAKTYLEQASRVLDVEKAEIHYNSEWLAPLTMKECVELCSQMTVARMLEREDLGSRFRNQDPIHIHEFLYALLQGFDSVAVKCDIELGATEQRFNLLVGRQLMEHFGLEPQIVMTLPILVGTDGAKKMSKSERNYIAILDSPTDMFGKIMSIPDEIIPHYFSLLTDKDEAEIKKMDEEIAKAKRGEKSANPMVFKLELAQMITERFQAQQYGVGIGSRERAKFLSAFASRDKEAIAQDVTIPAHLIKDGKINLVKFLIEIGAVKSAREARRLIKQGAVKLKVEGQRLPIKRETIELDPDPARLVKAAQGPSAILEVGKTSAYKPVLVAGDALEAVLNYGGPFWRRATANWRGVKVNVVAFVANNAAEKVLMTSTDCGSEPNIGEDIYVESQHYTVSNWAPIAGYQGNEIRFEIRDIIWLDLQTVQTQGN